MRPIAEFSCEKISVVFTDIDDTITKDGVLPAEAYQALWRLYENGFTIVPVTGRPAGWCEMIARFWPVHGIIGENGAFYFTYHRKNRKMSRYFSNSTSEREENSKKLKTLEAEILDQVPGAAVASDQFTRIADLAIDFCEDVAPLSEQSIDKIVAIFKKNGAQAKVSSIHVNGWFGSHDKLTACKSYLEQELSIPWSMRNEQCAFIGDSPNDEPLFAQFENSVGVANIKPFLKKLKSPPQFVCDLSHSDGFCQFVTHLLKK